MREMSKVHQQIVRSNEYDRKGSHVKDAYSGTGAGLRLESEPSEPPRLARLPWDPR